MKVIQTEPGVKGNTATNALKPAIVETGVKVKVPLFINEGDKIKIGKEILEVYFCPGHTPGHIIFFSRISKLAIVGDVLFNGSIGRTDLPGGNFDQLINSVKNKLWPLGNDIKFIPGHGPSSTFEEEKKSNPFVSESALNKT